MNLKVSDKIRVLIVDDSATIRKILLDSLSNDQEIDVVDFANNGKVALAKLEKLAVDVVTLDIEMPELNGLDTLKEIRKLYPKIKVIMVSSLTEKGGTITLDALSSGAFDYITKPTTSGNQKIFTQDLINKVLATKNKKTISSSPLRSSQVKTNNSIRTFSSGNESTGKVLNLRSTQNLSVKRDVLIIGVSTGGPNALSEVLPKLPQNFPLPILIVQHMPPIFTKLLADRLNSKCKFSVVEATNNMEISPGKAIIAPGDFHMLIRRDAKNDIIYVELDKGPHVHSCRPAVDPLFYSAVEVFSGRILSVIMTGMGYDGMNGAESVCKAGGFVLAQDEATSVVWGMPGAVVDKGLAHEVLPLNKISSRIVELATR